MQEVCSSLDTTSMGTQIKSESPLNPLQVQTGQTSLPVGGCGGAGVVGGVGGVGVSVGQPGIGQQGGATCAVGAHGQQDDPELW